MNNSQNINGLITEANEMASMAYALFGDKGSCVMGMSLSYKGTPIAVQQVQGATSTQEFFNEIIDLGVEKYGMEEGCFITFHGRMD